MENILCYLSNAVKYSANGKITVAVSLTSEDGTALASLSSDQNPAQSSSPRIPSNKCGLVASVHPQEDDCNDGLPSSGSRELELVDTPPAINKKQQLRISVTDEGIGVSDAMMLNLFQPFQQTMRLAGGTGLGLYSLSKRIEVLGGRFGVEKRSDGRQGSVFWFSVPYVPDEAFSNAVSSLVVGDAAAGEEEATAEEKDASGKLSALVVEDSTVISKATSRMLKKVGYAVDVAENGAIGLGKMKKKCYSLVVMDLQMPVMDGLEATRRIRAFEEEEEGELCGTPLGGAGDGRRKQFIVGTSANGADDVMQDALRSGMDEFVPKPFSVSNLIKYQAQVAHKYSGEDAV